MPTGPSDQPLPSATVPRPPEETPTIVVPEPRPLLELTPGTILLDRYRIVSRLGKGGMGEVYRADDLKLGLPVALKFVVPRLAAHQQQLLEEVRVGRKVSHPNVCRLHDIGEIDGRLFLSMEYIDGEDLASLLRRIGRLPHDKAASLAREITSGLVAAHDGGIVHRDLKPANVMIDSRGSARITDFGLAGATATDTAARYSGTPPYMAPEQFAGAAATTASDVYALGLIFFELWTGRRLIAGTTVSDIVAAHSPEVVRATVRDAPELEPQIASVIDVCLDDDPARRPATARAVLAMLPGRDALDSAAASGQTPSPMMVAAAADRGELSRTAAWTLVAATVAMLAALLIISERTSLHRLIPLRYTPAQLEARSLEVLEASGWSALPRADSAGWFLRHDRFLRWRERSSEGARASLIRAVFFIHRQSPGVMVSTFVRGHPMLSEEDPPLRTPEMASVKLDSEGRLFSLEVVPPVRLNALPPIHADWGRLLQLAGLDERKLRRVAPAYAVAFDNDERAAWEGVDPIDGMPLRVEAAALRGRPVSFAVDGPWSVGATGAVPPRPGDKFADLVLTLIVIAVVLGVFMLVRRHLRRGQGDTRGALRVGLFVLVTVSIAGILRAHHVADAIAESELGSQIFMRAVYLSMFVWAIYLATEPLARRRFPRALVSWSRLLEGRLLDPMIGRDVLIGFAAAAATYLAGHFVQVGVAFVTKTTPAPYMATMWALTSARFVLFFLPYAVVVGIAGSAALLIELVLVRGIVRSQKAAIVVVTVLLCCAAFPLTAGAMPLRIAEAVAVSIVPVAVLVRFGMVAGAATIWLLFVLTNVPLTLDPRAWYFPSTVGVLAVILAILGFAFHRALGGKPVFAGPLFEE